MSFISNIKRSMLKLGMVVAFAAVLAAPQIASANTGAGASIVNVVTVNYQSPGGVALVASASATVTVTLVPAAVNLAAVGPTANSTPSGTATTYTFTATATANGSDTYNLNSVAGIPTNANPPTLVFKQGATTVTSLTLGASVITNVVNATTLQIPAGSETNLAPGDVVVVGGTDYVIQTITPGTAATANVGATTAGLVNAETPTQIVLAANPAGSNTAPVLTAGLVGSVIGEQQTFTLDVTSTTIAPGDGTVPVDVTVGGPAPGTPITPAITTTTTVQGANLTITKEVSSDGGLTFGPTGSGAPGSTLTYRITVTNGGGGAASNVIVTDPMPAYTTYAINTAKSATTIGALYNAVGNTVLTDAVDADGYDFGITAANTATLNAGTIAAGASVVLFYQVTIQ